MRKATYFMDVDGVIIKHKGATSIEQWHGHHELLPGVREWFAQREKEGDCIVLTTARKECCRQELETCLRGWGLFWDQLVMGITSGSRVLINDGNPNGQYTTASIQLTRNEGLCRLLL